MLSENIHLNNDKVHAGDFKNRLLTSIHCTQVEQDL